MCQVANTGIAVSTVGRRWVAATLVEGMQTRCLHQPGDTMLAAVDAGRAQFGMHAGTAVHLAALLECLADLLGQLLILSGVDRVSICATHNSHLQIR